LGLGQGTERGGSASQRVSKPAGERGGETAKISAPPGCDAGVGGDRSQVSSAATNGPLSAPLRAGTWKPGARLELVVLYAYEKRENAGLEAHIKYAQQGENMRFQVYSAHFLHISCAFFACIFDTRSQVSSAAADESFRQARGRHRDAGRTIGKGRPICLQKKKENVGLRAYKRRG
jgi:hypothetical protein